MDEHHRVKREPPERTEPKRQWTDNFTTARESTQEGTGSTDPRDAAYQTINDAYRLIDDYIRQGQQSGGELLDAARGISGSVSRSTRTVHAYRGGYDHGVGRRHATLDVD